MAMKTTSFLRSVASAVPTTNGTFTPAVRPAITTRVTTYSTQVIGTAMTKYRRTIEATTANLATAVNCHTTTALNSAPTNAVHPFRKTYGTVATKCQASRRVVHTLVGTAIPQTPDTRQAMTGPFTTVIRDRASRITGEDVAHKNNDPTATNKTTRPLVLMSARGYGLHGIIRPRFP